MPPAEKPRGLFFCLQCEAQTIARIRAKRGHWERGATFDR